MYKHYINLLRIITRSQEAIRKVLDKVDLTSSQYDALYALDEEGSMTQGVLADRIAKSAPDLVMVLDNLEQKGMVWKSKHYSDRRFTTISITPEGRSLLDSIRVEYDTELDKVLNQIFEK